MTQNEQGATAPKISYCLSNLEPKEVQFLIDLIVNVPQPLVVTQPIYQKIVGQVQAQDKAREEAAQKKKADADGKKEPSPPPAPKAPGPRNSKTK